MKSSRGFENYTTTEQARVKSDKSITAERLEELLEIADSAFRTSDVFRSKANMNGVNVEFRGNSLHQFEFWKLNWMAADESAPVHARIFSVQGVDDVEPSAYYCPDQHTAVFFNTEYYGQCKSWALGASAHILEDRSNTLSIHGASVDVGGKGVVIIAPTGTGKTTQSFRLMMRPEAKLMGDDWVYVPFPPSATGKARALTATQPEKCLYMRTETELGEAWLRDIFDGSKCENVVTEKRLCRHTVGDDGCAITKKRCVFNDGKSWCYYAFENARAMVPRELLMGPNKITDGMNVRLVILLERVPGNPQERRLASDEALEVLRKGEYMVRPGAGPEEMWGKIGREPYYNPYLLRLDPAKQDGYFRRMFSDFGVSCILLNTAHESVEQTHRRILGALGALD